MDHYIFISSSKKKDNDEQYHIVKVTKSGEKIDLLAKCNAVVEDVHPHVKRALKEIRFVI